MVAKLGNIHTLDDLINEVGKSVTDCIFTEYMMDMVAKVQLLDKIIEIINAGGSIDDIKELL